MGGSAELTCGGARRAGAGAGIGGWIPAAPPAPRPGCGLALRGRGPLAPPDPAPSRGPVRPPGRPLPQGRGEGAAKGAGGGGGLGGGSRDGRPRARGERGAVAGVDGAWPGAPRQESPGRTAPDRPASAQGCGWPSSARRTYCAYRTVHDPAQGCPSHRIKEVLASAEGAL